MILFFSLKISDKVLHEEIFLPERVHFLYSYIFFLPERVHEEAALFICHNLREQIKAVLRRSAFFHSYFIVFTRLSRIPRLLIENYIFYVSLNL